MTIRKSFSRRLYETKQFTNIQSVKKLVRTQPIFKKNLTGNGAMLPIHKDLFVRWNNETLWPVCRLRSYAFEQVRIHPDLRYSHGFPLETFTGYRKAAQTLR